MESRKHLAYSKMWLEVDEQSHLYTCVEHTLVGYTLCVYVCVCVRVCVCTCVCVRVCVHSLRWSIWMTTMVSCSTLTSPASPRTLEAAWCMTTRSGSSTDWWVQEQQQLCGAELVEKSCWLFHLLIQKVEPFMSDCKSLSCHLFTVIDELNSELPSTTAKAESALKWVSGICGYVLTLYCKSVPWSDAQDTRY